MCKPGEEPPRADQKLGLGPESPRARPRRYQRPKSGSETHYFDGTRIENRISLCRKCCASRRTPVEQTNHFRRNHRLGVVAPSSAAVYSPRARTGWIPADPESPQLPDRRRQHPSPPSTSGHQSLHANFKFKDSKSISKPPTENLDRKFHKIGPPAVSSITTSAWRQIQPTLIIKEKTNPTNQRPHDRRQVDAPIPSSKKKACAS